ncbi:MAG: hypothetical protein NC416_01220 [Eubacterium sp.]|nr:hypothetical protein [Eubacterium sp.]
METERRKERYINKSGKIWVRIKYMDAARTEVVMPEREYMKRYGNINGHIV